ncbi:hypothetical protein CXB77_11720 [Chromatium okenii]|uniref:Uncharacterized protein n=1 Tax=Chromatium okenii TaxID=61644 RepID=A0A2S7XQA6_9GAMM|nr:hypothetical protein CXB77_11720 [Chromatium okenii]
MRRWLLSMALLLLTAPPVLAVEPVLARVLSVERDRVTLLVQDETASPITVIRAPNELPIEIVPGALVRLWPGATPDAHGVSIGAQFSPLERGNTQMDRTGVRARLMRGAERGAPGRRGGR